MLENRNYVVPSVAVAVGLLLMHTLFAVNLKLSLWPKHLLSIIVSQGGGKRATPFVVDLNKSKRNQKENEEEVNK